MTGDKLREVCIDPPRGSWRFLAAFHSMKGCSEATPVLALLKGVYGQKNAPKAWRIKLDLVLKKLGATPMKSVSCLYMWHDKRNAFYCIASTHADDLKMAGKDEEVKRIIAGLEKEVVTPEEGIRIL